MVTPAAPNGRLSPPPPHVVAAALGVNSLTIEWLAGDGSDRCYFRIRSPEFSSTKVLMQLSGQDSEMLKQGRYDWLEISKALRDQDVAAPSAIAILGDHAALIIDDYGDVMLETLALAEQKKGSLSNILPYYEDAIDVIAKFLSIKPTAGAVWITRSFDKERFMWELKFFASKYLQQVAQYRWTGAEEALFLKDAEQLSEYLSASSDYFVHRDFHSRNIMICLEKAAVIDFQDARLGPPAYDLVSLCFDSYVPFSGAERLSLLQQGIQAVRSVVGEHVGQLIDEQWRATLLQRQLKAIGSFGYLTVDKNKGDYLKNVAPALLTLEESSLFDTRWPFLSDGLLKILRRTLPGKAP